MKTASIMAKKAVDKSISLHDLEREYRETLPLAERFCKEVSGQIQKVLEDKKITLGFPIEYRVKKWDSIVSKVERLSLTLPSIKALNDLIGFRLILLFKRDLSEVCDVLSKTLKVQEQYDTGERLKEDQFGYSSIHFIVELPETWLAVPTLVSLRGLRAELQVRTVAQHIWAAASHHLQYKHEESVPPPIRRAIYRVSALLETVDLEFNRVLEQRAFYREDVNISETSDTLNVDLLEKALDLLLPAGNKESNENYGDLLTEFLHFGVNTVSKLRALVERHLPKILEIEAEAVEQLRNQKFLGKELAERVSKGVFYSYAGLARKALAKEFGDDYLLYLVDQSIGDLPT